ncbi:MAG: hypothetical protein R2716_10705 [Microthrixaceae bacterium]
MGEKIEVSHWRGIVAAGAVVALIGLGLRIQPCWSGSLWRWWC